MFDPFVVYQAYIINYTLAFFPQMATDPSELRLEWQPLSAFYERPTEWSPKNLVVPDVGRLAFPPPAIWPEGKWHFSSWPRPLTIETDNWRFEWLSDVGLPPYSNPSTSLFFHFYPFGVMSIGLATAVGFESGIEIPRLALLLKRMTPSRDWTKPPWLRIVSPKVFAGMEVSLNHLAEIILGKVRETLFRSPTSAQVIGMRHESGEAHLWEQHGGIVDLVRTAPQFFDKSRHAAGFRGIVTMRPSWEAVEPERLIKYRDASSWTGRPDAWHYAGGLNTVLWHTAPPSRRTRRTRRGYTWRVAAVSELARMEKVLYTYCRDFVVKRAHDRLLQEDPQQFKSSPVAEGLEQLRLGEWKRLWLVLEDLSSVLATDDLMQTYESHREAFKTERAQRKFRTSLVKYSNALRELGNREMVRWGQDITEIVSQARLSQLRKLLAKRFDREELRTLCFELGVDYDDLPTQGKANKARELVAYMDRRECIDDLVDKGRELRADIDWESIS